MKTRLLAFSLLVAAAPLFVAMNPQLARAADVSPTSFDVRAYGAKGDGKSLDTGAINAAIDACAKAGGGTILFRAGVYPAFSIHLQSKITLYLDQGAYLLAAGPTLGGLRGPDGGNRLGGRRGGGTPATEPATAPATLVGPVIPQPGSSAPVSPPVAQEILNLATAYDAPEPNPFEFNPDRTNNQDFGHSHWHNSLIWGENLHDIAILGPGMIDGNGLAFNPPANARGVGNKALALKLCRNVTLRDFSFYRGGHFCILATAVDNFTIDNVKFDTTRDSMDIVSCKNVRISNCYVNSPVDDGICLKADYSLGAPRDCENITITNCLVSGFVMGSMLNATFDRSNANAANQPTGRIKFGTESNGGFKNITISNCTFDHSRGLALESVDGGVIEDVSISNLTMRDINNSPIFIRLGNRHRSPLGVNTPVAQIRRVNISNINASGCAPRFPVNISGIPGHAIEDLRLSNIRIAYLGGDTRDPPPATTPENEAGYPEPSMFGVLPSSAFFIRHVKNLEMHHIDVTFDKDDFRPALVLDDVAGADFQHMNIQRMVDVPLFKLTKVAGFSTQAVRGIADMEQDQIQAETISK